MNLQSILQPGEPVVYSTRGESFIEPFIALLGLMAGFVPAWGAYRARITDALRTV